MFSEEYFYELAKLNDQNLRYTKHFFDYIKNALYSGGELKKEYLSHLTIDDLLDSLNSYMNKGNSISKTTATQYLGCLNKVFEYLEHSFQIQNEIYVNGRFVPPFETVSQTYLSQYVEAQDTSTASDEEFNSLLSKIHEMEMNYSYDEASNGLERYWDTNYHKSLSQVATIRAVCATRLVLEVGLKNEELSSIKCDDVRLDESVIKRGRYSVPISDELKRIFYEYLRIREYILNRKGKTTNILFIDQNGDPIAHGQEGAKLLNPTIGKERDGKTGSAFFAKRFIARMIIAGVNLATIEEITGYGYPTCKDVCDFVNTVYVDSNQKRLLGNTFPNESQEETRISHSIKCPSCRKTVEATSNNLVLLKCPGDETLYLYCKSCGEKKIAEYRR